MLLPGFSFPFVDESNETRLSVGDLLPNDTIQKASIVREIKERKRAMTLAIGDGANDEAMILEADVGVGISGLEGTAASRASSYAIGQFRFLHTLLFVHGHWSYRRIAMLVPYIFYKAILVVVCMFWFGFDSAFFGLVDCFLSCCV